MACPNINVKEWKNMVAHVGEFEAYRAYMAHNETIPNAVPMSQLKRTIGLTGGPYSVERQIGIKNKIRKWNNENGTSHFVEFTRKGESEFSTATIRFNYLPVNKKEQADRDKRRRMEGYIGVMDGESFEDVWTPSESEQEAGQFEDGDFIPPSYFPASEKYRKGPKFQKYMDVKGAELTTLYSERADYINERKKTSNPGEKREISKKLRAVEEKIGEVENTIKTLANQDRLDQIGTYAEEDMETLAAIFSKPNPTGTDLELAKRLIKIWQQAGDFSGDNPHVFYDPDEFTDRDDALEEVTENFRKWKEQADSYNVKLIKAQDEYLKREIGGLKGFADGENLDWDEPLPDIDFLTKNVLDVSEVDHIIFQALAKWIKDANFAAREDLREDFKKLDELIEAAGLKDYSIFQQTFSNTDSRLTGDMVNKYSQSYFDWSSGVKSARRLAVARAEGIENDSTRNNRLDNANREFIDEMQKNAEIIDPRIFFWDNRFTTKKEPTEAEKQKEEQRLRDLLGDKEFEKQYKIAKENVELFKEDLEAFKDHIVGQTDGQLTSVTNTFIEGWIADRSPYLFGDLMEEGYDKVRLRVTRPGASMQYIQSFPKKVDENGKDLGYYDSKFAEIENNPALLNLYNFIDEKLQEMKALLPSEKTAFMHMNSIPFIRKEMLDAMMSNGAEKGFGNILRERLTESVRMPDTSEIGKEEEKDELQVRMLQNNKSRINQYVQLQDTQWRADNNGEDPGTKRRAEWRKDIMDIIAKEKSFDLGKVVKAFSAMAVTYKHKSAIEDQIRTAQDIIERSVEARENYAGDKMKDKYGNLLGKKGLKNLQDMMENFLDVAYWGYMANIPEGRMDKKKVLNKSEKAVMETLEESQKQLDQLLEEEKISQSEYDVRSNVITEQKEVLGGIRAYSKFGDVLLKYIQYKGMGWNIYAAFSNMGFGLISNIVEASDGRNYSMKSYRKAMALVLNSVVKNGTFNLVETGTAKKIRSLMDRLDVLKESRNELYKTTEGKLFSRLGERLEWTKPFNPQSRSEYFNQAPVMIAMMMDTYTTNSKGEKVSMWDMFDNDGNIKEGEKIDFADLANLKGNVDQVVKMNHGNYDSDKPLGLKRKFIGRALSQFRTWAFQGFAERFRKEFKDRNLTNKVTGEDYLMRKGRYRSYVAYFNQFDNYGALRLPVDLTYQLLRKLVGRHTTFESMADDEQFTEVDAANMRKNLTEIVLTLIMAALVAALKAGIDDDDEKDKKLRKLATNLVINQVGRLTTDIMFYTNPMEFERLTRNALPVFSLVVDAAKAFDSLGKLIFQGSEADILQSGPDKGKSRTWRDFQKLIPGPVQYKKIQSAAHQVYKKK